MVKAILSRKDRLYQHGFIVHDDGGNEDDRKENERYDYKIGFLMWRADYGEYI